MPPNWHKQNWSGHTPYGAVRFHRPKTVTEVQDIVRGADKVKVVGSRHCFNDIADTTGDLLWLGDFDSTAVIDRERRTATVGAGITYEALCPQLERAGFALANLPSLKHVTVVGACMTATHGSGDALGNLSTAVSKLEMVTADGERVEFARERDSDTFRGAVVAIGALGVVTRVTLDLEPSFFVQQDNYENLPFRDVFAHFDEITGAGYSVSLFPTWQHDVVENVWVKHRVPSLAPVDMPRQIFGATLASANPSGDPAPDRTRTPCGRPGVWYERLPHYAFHDAWAVGNELQSEYFIARKDAVAAIAAVLALRAALAPVLGRSEIRTVRADDLWLSSAHGQDTVAIHFNWLKDREGVARVLPILEAALAPFGVRPHLGKLFAMSAAQLAVAYPRWKDFRQLVRRFDPAGKFSNRFLEKYVLR